MITDVMEGLVFSDFSVCSPSDGLSRNSRENSWLLVDYETEEGLQGTMIFADPEFGAPRLELPLGLKGLHKIYIGINYTKSHYGLANGLPFSHYGNLEVKLTDDLGFTRIAAEVDDTAEGKTKMGSGKLLARSIQETYWKTADLTGQSVWIQMPGQPYNLEAHREMANVSWIRVVPLTSEEEQLWRELQPRPDTRRGAYMYCAGALSGHIDGGPDFHPTSLNWFKNELTPCLNNDIDLFIVEAIRGNYCTFNSKIGDVGGTDNRWKEEWIDPLEAFTKLGQENNLKVFAGMRMIGGQYPTSRHPISWASFFRKHPEWVKVDRNSYPTTSLSIAYPGVQDYWLSLLSEALEYGVDGLAIYLHRFNPFVLYEEPVVTSFIEKHGEDPRALSEYDPRWVQHCADYLTGFLRKVRKLVDEKPGRKLAVTFFGTHTKLDPDPLNWEPIRYNYDVDTWIREGIADYLLPMQAPKPSLIKKWIDLSEGREVHIWPDLHPRHMPGEEFAKMAKKYYEAGANGFCFNDGERRSTYISEWAIESRLGHIDLLDKLEELGPTYYNRVPIKTMNGYVTRYSYNNFGDTDVEWFKKQAAKAAKGEPS